MESFVIDRDVFVQALDVHSIVSVADVRGNILYVNDLFCRVSGYSREELLGKNHRIVKSDQHPPEVFKAMWRSIAKGDVWQGDIKNKKKNGGFYWVKTMIMPVLNTAGKPYQYVSIRTDITDRKLAESALVANREKLKTALRVQSEFLSRMSHEIKTPLTGIIGMGEILKETDLDAEQTEFVSELLEASGRLQKFLDDMLDLKMVHSGQIKPENIMVRVSDFMLDIEGKWQPVAQNQGVRFDCCRAGNLPDILKFDPTYVHRIIDELLNNAFKYTGAGKVTFCIRLGDDATVITEVTDTGIGISKDAIDAVFSPFNQNDMSNTREHDGAGLGLAVCKDLVTYLGGEIKVASQLGQGSQFKMILPLLPIIL
ncbi:MAG: PAS domain S-box protein [Amylibacter sp.]|nr:PAS domain S-box protein [Amylibacter sp.]